MKKKESPYGTVKLMYDDSTVKREETYYSANHRARILERWKNLYPSKETFIIHICPGIGALRIKEVIRHQKQKQESVPDKISIVRPPAVYGNTGRSLYP